MYMGMKLLSLIALFVILSFSSYASMAEGVIYFKDGTSVRYDGKDRIVLPKGSSSVKCYRHAYSSSKEKMVYTTASVDSIVFWHPSAAEYKRTLVPVRSVGWCWVYVDAPCIRAYIFSKKGYGVSANGGMSTLSVVYPSGRSSRVAFYLRKSGDDDVFPLGGVYKRSGDSFRDRICDYIADDPELCDKVRRSSSVRSKTVSMLAGYRSGNSNK